MQTAQFYPVIQTSNVAGTADFYRDHFDFLTMFENDWYVHLQQSSRPSVNLAILKDDHYTIPAVGRGPTRGLLINFEVEDVDAEVSRLQQAKVPIVQELRNEEFGQRHAIFIDPNGVLIDVVCPIPPSGEYVQSYVAEALPVAEGQVG